MSSSSEELSLGSRLTSRVVSKIRNAAERVCNLEKLEEEKIKIKDYELELPLCLQILNDAISFLRDEENKRCLELSTKPLLKDLNEECREGDGIDLQIKKNNKDSVSSSFQIWKANDQSSINTNKAETEMKKGKSLTGSSLLSPELTTPKVETGLGLRLITSSSMVNGGRRGITTSYGSTLNSVVSVSHQATRKQRRSWTPELHNRFLDALDKLGGPGVATPKQIREHMQEAGLTNDEVKSHLQKYRLHIRKPCSNPEKQVVNVLGFNLWIPQEEEAGRESAKRRRSSSESDSPQGPLQLTTTGGDSMEEEEDIEDAISFPGDEENKRCLEISTKPLLKDLNKDYREGDEIDLQINKNNKDFVSFSFQLWKANEQSSNNTNKAEAEVETGLSLGLTSSSVVNGGRRGITTSYGSTSNSVVYVSPLPMRK